jgi:hypothetical protein
MCASFSGENIMKTFFIGVAGLGVGGAAWYGMDSPDFDRTINRSPTAVYSAFATLSNEGTVRAPSDNELGREVAIRTSKERGKSLRYEILIDDRPVLTADLTFEPAGEGGTATRMTAELDIDAMEIGSAFETEAGIALSMVPDSYIDAQFAHFMDELADDVEAGRTLPPLRSSNLGMHRRASADVRERRADALREQRAAVRPMTDARPMVDPNAAAQAHLNGRPNPNDDSGR